MEHKHCKNCGTCCDACIRCDHCGHCKNCGNMVALPYQFYYWPPVIQPQLPVTITQPVITWTFTNTFLPNSGIPGNGSITGGSGISFSS